MMYSFFRAGTLAYRDAIVVGRGRAPRGARSPALPAGPGSAAGQMGLPHTVKYYLLRMQVAYDVAKTRARSRNIAVDRYVPA